MKKIITILSFCLLSGCLGGYSPQSKFYNLQPLSSSQTTPLSTKKLSIGISPTELPDYIDKPQIISFDKGNPQMNIDELNRWGEPLDSMIQRTIASDIALYLPNSIVKPKSSLLEKFNFLVDVQIIRFDMIKNQQAILDAWWYISTPNGTILKRQQSSFNAPIKKGYNSYANIMSDLLGKMSKSIAEQLIKY